MTLMLTLILALMLLMLHNLVRDCRLYRTRMVAWRSTGQRTIASRRPLRPLRPLPGAASAEVQASVDMESGFGTVVGVVVEEWAIAVVVAAVAAVGALAEVVAAEHRMVGSIVDGSIADIGLCKREATADIACVDRMHKLYR
jgi:hypothetical protein